MEFFTGVWTTLLIIAYIFSAYKTNMPMIVITTILGIITTAVIVEYFTEERCLKIYGERR